MHKFLVRESFKSPVRRRLGAVTFLSTALVLAATSPVLHIPAVENGIIAAAKPGSPQAGAVCSKLGKRVTSNKIELVCKAGKTGTLRWVKVEKKPQKTALPVTNNETAAPTSIPVTETAAPTSIPVTETAAPTSIPVTETTSTAATQAASTSSLPQLPSWEFSKGYALNSDGKLKNSPLGFVPEFGPSTSKEIFEPIVSGIEHAYELFTGTLQRLKLPSVPKIPVVLAEAKDADWFFTTIAKHGHNSPGFEQNNRARMVSEGGSLMAAGLSTYASTPLLLVLRGPDFNYGEWEEVNVGAHEYTHAVQSTLGDMRSMPCWAREGGATYFSVRIAIQVAKDPEKATVGFDHALAYSVRTGWRGENYRPTSDDEIIDLLRRSEPQSNATCTSEGKVGYSLGLLVSEAQAKQWGEDAMIQWWVRAGQIGWRPAWKEIYNVDADIWMKETAVPHIQSRLKALPRHR